MLCKEVASAQHVLQSVFPMDNVNISMIGNVVCLQPTFNQPISEPELNYTCAKVHLQPSSFRISDYFAYISALSQSHLHGGTPCLARGSL